MNLQLVKWKKFSPRRMVLSAFFLTLVQTAAARVGNIQLSKQIFLSNWTSNSQAAWSSTTMERLAQRMSVSWSGSSFLAAGEPSWWYHLEERLRSIPSCALISFCPAESLMIELGQNRLMMDLWIRKSYNTHLDKTCSFDNTLTVDEIWHGMTTEIYWWFNKFIIKIDKPCT